MSTTTQLLLALALFVFAIGGFFFLLREIKRMGRRSSLGDARKDLAARWKSVEEMMGRNDEMSYKLALMEADKLLDHALKAKMFAGNTLGERLKIASYKYPKLKAVWPAHILRNKLVHDAHFHLYPNSARRALRQFKAALTELGVL